MSRNKARIRVSDVVLRKVISEELIDAYEHFNKVIERVESVLHPRSVKLDVAKVQAVDAGVVAANISSWMQRFFSRCERKGIDVSPLMLLVTQGKTFGEIQRISGLSRTKVHNHLKLALQVWQEMSRTGGENSPAKPG